MLQDVSTHVAHAGELQILKDFTPVSAELLKERELLKRIDRKYLMSQADLPILLRRLVGDYGVLYAGKHMVARYESYYYDTPDLRAFHDHRMGRRPRFKVRIRHHVDRSKSFLEVKRKGNDGQTDKSRAEREMTPASMLPTDRAFIKDHTPYDLDQLVQTAQTHFRRVTLCSTKTAERVTIDFQLELLAGTSAPWLPGAAIVEVKQERLCHTTTAAQVLRDMRVREMSASKYCLAIARLGETGRINSFLPALKAIRRMCHE
jgi:hypothetical protein